MGEEPEKKLCQFITTYAKDYIKKKYQKTPNCKIEQEFKDPVAYSYQKYLEIDDEDIKPPIEDGDVYLERLKEKRKKLGNRYFGEPLAHKPIKWQQILDKKTTYQVDYCDIEGDMLKQLATMRCISKRLPDGWVFPLTTQKNDFRDPASSTEFGLDYRKPILPRNNLTTDETFNDIMQLQKPDSEYNAVYGKLGELIIENEMHGKIEKVE